MAKLSRIALLSRLALPVTLVASTGEANPWLERSNAIAQPWDLPFIAQPRSDRKIPHRRSRNPRLNSQATPQATSQAGFQAQRDLQRTPEQGAAPAESAPAANVFPPPRPPAAASSPAPDQAATARTARAGERSREPASPVRDRNPQSVGLRQRDADRDAERKLERQLKRELPRLQAPAKGVPQPPGELACAERLARIARYEPLPARSGPNGCGASDLVRLEGVLMPDRSVVAIEPPPQIRCGMAEEFAGWIRDEVSPVAAVELGSPLASIAGNDAYECRTRNGVKGAKISEHGRGNAFDLATFRLKNGGVFNFTDPLVAKPFRERVRSAACNRFMTVLGPGSDAFHSQHIHLDMAERSSKDAKVCQWEVREVQVAARSDGPRPEPPVEQPANAEALETNPDSPIADVVSPPLPRRKPEALLARAQAERDGQRGRDGKRERGVWRGERAKWSFRNRDFRMLFRW